MFLTRPKIKCAKMGTVQHEACTVPVGVECKDEGVCCNGEEKQQHRKLKDNMG